MDPKAILICFIIAAYSIDHFVNWAMVEWAKFLSHRVDKEMDLELDPEADKQAEEILWPVAHLQLDRDPMAGDQIVFYSHDGRFVLDMEVKSIRQVHGHNGAKGWQ